MSAALAMTPAETALDLRLPHRRQEDWRWTDLRQLIDRPYPPRQKVEASAEGVERLVRSSPFAAIAARRMVFINGEYVAGLSQLANGDCVSCLSADEPLLQLNEAFATAGARLTLSGQADTPIELLFIATAAEPRTIATRSVIELTPGASATLIETHLGEGSYLASSLTEIRLGNGARLDRIKVEIEADDAIHLAHLHATLGADVSFRDFTLTAGAGLNRQNGTYIFAGEGGDARIAGAYLLGRSQHADTRLLVDHKAARCTSRELFKCVMDGRSRGIFQGKVVVRPGAQKTDGKQSSHALLLSGEAEFDAKPELEIFADDVACGHGATSGDIDHDHLFYLRSRGIPEKEAKSLLVAAFVGEALENVGDEALRAVLECLAGSRLEAL